MSLVDKGAYQGWTTVCQLHQTLLLSAVGSKLSLPGRAKLNKLALPSLLLNALRALSPGPGVCKAPGCVMHDALSGLSHTTQPQALHSSLLLGQQLTNEELRIGSTLKKPFCRQGMHCIIIQLWRILYMQLAWRELTCTYPMPVGWAHVSIIIIAFIIIIMIITIISNKPVCTAELAAS